MLLLTLAHQDIRAWERFEELEQDRGGFIEGGPSLWEKIGIRESTRAAMSKALGSDWPDREIERCEKLGVRLIGCRDPIYPRSLLELNDAPIVIYVRGRHISLQPKVVGIVGTRRCSSYAVGVAKDLGRLCASRSWSVASGGAKGIDAVAHGSCLDGGGLTAAVLGTGVDVTYPFENQGLFERIMENGALISEFPLGTNGEAWHFPKRNRIIVGLSSRIVVVEAPAKSGALITARIAADCGREVWAVPGRITDDRCGGSNKLIFDGAFPLIDMESFFGEGDYRQPKPDDGQETAEIGAETRASLSDVEKTLMALLTNSGDRTIDNLASEAKMSAAEVFRTMSMLSLRGLVYSSGAGRYRLTDA
jgi:DNA processing protein